MWADHGRFVACVVAYAMFARLVLVGVVDAGWTSLKRAARKLIVFYVSK